MISLLKYVVGGCAVALVACGNADDAEYTTSFSESELLEGEEKVADAPTPSGPGPEAAMFNGQRSAIVNNHYNDDRYRNTCPLYPPFATNQCFTSYFVNPIEKGWEVESLVEQIDRSRTDLLALSDPSLDLWQWEQNDTLLATILSKLPDFTGVPDIVRTLYSHVEPIGAGGRAIVYKATLNTDRPSHGLKKGDIIAVRTTAICSFTSIQNISINSRCSREDQGLITLAKLSGLGARAGESVTDYFPEFYGGYIAPAWDPRDNPPLGRDEDWSFMYQEMEYVGSMLESDYTMSRSGVPDSLFFEHAMGEFASRSIHHIRVTDQKARQLGLHRVNYARVYHIGSDVYTFPPGITPKRVDLDSITRPQGYEGSTWLTPARKELESLRFDADLLASLRKYFHGYLVTDLNPISSESSTRHYWVPIPNEWRDKQN